MYLSITALAMLFSCTVWGGWLIGWITRGILQSGDPDGVDRQETER